jgi:hypothetical protein
MICSQRPSLRLFCPDVSPVVLKFVALIGGRAADLDTDLEPNVTGTRVLSCSPIKKRRVSALSKQIRVKRTGAAVKLRAWPTNRGCQPSRWLLLRLRPSGE